ncbi:MAG TPA: HEAT repeat domain-containing protein [Myxococcota bacterium]|nr:HEAT repeat domain-containing protein [Myxococcota bacterium]HON26488.1 HEAT repeat domain-containing protein [Myxococcota bacterium]HOS63092.1 HEAT repeat domain-containing protein [Myxococcota bacterium]HPC92768.1 HEAT repeat domain-containing protein [Myxococcota bacterium]HPL26298.1 HEAT repeat domain-containing protein [Myxococcota bacterium]
MAKHLPLQKSIFTPLLVALVCSLMSHAALALDGALPMLYVSTQVAQGGQAISVLIPRGMNNFDAKRQADSALRAFDQLKALHPTEYGKATLTLDATKDNVRSATINLDPSRADDHDKVASEVFYTLSSLGITVIKAPLLQAAALDPSALKTPVFMLVMPVDQLLPPKTTFGCLVPLAAGEFITCEQFSSRLAKGDPTLVDRALAGLSSPNENTRLTVLKSLDSINAPNKTSRIFPLLSDPSSTIRLTAIELLASEKGPEINDRLSGVVENDQDPAVKLAAVRALSARGVSKYDVFLQIESLSDPSDKVVVEAIKKLVASKNAVAGPPLARMLKHAQPSVRIAARDGLITIGARNLTSQALADEELDLETREYFAKDLAKNGSADLQLKGLIWLLARGSETAAIDATKQLASIKPAAGLQALVATLSRTEPNVRYAAADAIAEWRDPNTVTPLLAAGKTPQDAAKFEAAAIKIIAAQPLDVTLKLMEDPDVTTRRLAMKALGDSMQGSQPPPKVVTVLQARLSDPDLGIRRAAVYALARIPDPSVSASIMAKIKDPDPEIREAAVVAAAQTQGAQAEGILIEALNDESNGVKKAALIAIEKRRLEAAREPLRLLGRYGDNEVRRLVVKAFLSLLGPGEAPSEFDFLLSLLYDGDPEIKQTVIPVFATIKERRALNMLAGLVIDPSAEVKLTVIQALAATGERDAIEGLQRAIFDEDTVIRVAALKGLEQLGRKEAIPFLEEVIALERDPEFKQQATATRDLLKSL